MLLRDLKRFVRALLPNVEILSSRKLPEGVMGVSWWRTRPWIVYAQGLGERERDLTILHELAHHMYGDTKLLAYARGPYARDDFREDRADRWAEQTLELLEDVVTQRSAWLRKEGNATPEVVTLYASTPAGHSSSKAASSSRDSTSPKEARKRRARNMVPGLSAGAGGGCAETEKGGQ